MAISIAPPSRLIFNRTLATNIPTNTPTRIPLNQCLTSGRHNQAAGFLFVALTRSLKIIYDLKFDFLFVLYVFF